MEMESGGEDMAFQEQPITGDGPDQESAVGCVTEDKKVLRSEKIPVQNPSEPEPSSSSKVCSAL